MSAPTVSAKNALVTAVIPTRNRPELATKAVESALHQTYPSLEVVVILDGPDPETLHRLTEVKDPRLHVVMLPSAVGGSEARNIGVRSAHGEWIAFLDDDDEWLPEKIARQMRGAAACLRDRFPVLSSRFIATTPVTRFCLPRVLYRDDQAVGDYLFCREGFAKSGGILQTSTLLIPRELLLAVPFRAGLKMHQDWDWVLRAAVHKGVSIHMLSEPLAICRIEDSRSSVGRAPDWKFSLQWLRERKEYLSPCAFSWFIAVQCVWRAAQSGASLREKLSLLHAFLIEGRPTWRAGAHFLAFACIPASARKWIRNRVWAFRRGSGDPGPDSNGHRQRTVSKLQNGTI
jgi:glycosyltransferase involved in cell wall biosynthesis